MSINTDCELDVDIVTTISKDLEPHVILFNDEEHTFDEVIEQLMKALGCNYYKAEIITIEVHNKGKAIVYSGSIEKCFIVSSILEEIQLKTEIIF